MTEDEKKVYEGICKKATLAYKEHLKAFKEGLSEEEIKKLKKFKEKLKKYRKEQKEIKAGTYVEVRMYVCLWRCGACSDVVPVVMWCL